MFSFLHRKILQFSTIDSASHVYFLQNPSLKSFSHATNTTNQPSFTLSYLMNTCGLSSENALSAAEKIHLKNTENPDSVLKLLQNHGFPKSHIPHLISKRPKLLSANPDKTLKPKIEFFLGLGVSGPVLSNLFSIDPNLFTMSLKNRIIPSFQSLKSLVGSHENAVIAFQRSTRLLQQQFQKVVRHNISALKDHGVTQSNISKFIVNYPRVLLLKPELFTERVVMVKEMGFNPSSWTFCLAVRVVSGMSKSTWESKLEVYRSLGFSQDEISSAFKVQPMFMLTSKKKIMTVIDFLVNEMNWTPSFISRCPNLFLLSLERRIIPRGLVLQILLSKGLINKELNLTWALKSTEKDFLEKFVIKNKDVVPEILVVYQSKMGVEGLAISSDEISNIEKL
ncbi:transcription termination factor MTERF15, mitochondrial-like [Tasmannia lanceolata]|uniref:transcription termination factor MTERF15, mitochondrial-like n=1 Tax=Tasmannia lanceolata TaxID=3420 RepID=UPI0040630083